MRRTQLALTAAIALSLWAAPALADAPASPTPAPVPTSWTGDLIVKFKPGADTSSGRVRAYRATQDQTRSREAVRDKRRLAAGMQLVDGGSDPVAALAALQARPDVEYAVPNRRVKAATNDPALPVMWSTTGTWGHHADQVWARTQGKGVRVAVLDSGKTNHPDLAGAYVGGYDFVSDLSDAGDGNGRDADPTDPGDFCLPSGEPSSWHGTAVAGLIAARKDNGTGTVGVAPQSQVVPVRVLGRCGGTEADVLDAMAWAAGIAVPGVPTNPYPARILNMSLGGIAPDACSPAMQEAINATRAKGALTIVASGNAGSPAANYSPGNCTGLVVVASIAKNGTRSSFANYGGPVSLVAGGGGNSSSPTTDDVAVLGLSAPQTNNGSYGVFMGEGTSFSAPQVSGIAALILAANPKLTVAQLQAALLKGVRPAPSCSGCGAGVADASVALSWVPSVSSIQWPLVPLSGGAVTLRGAGLGHVTKVTVGGRAATSVTAVNDTTVTAVLPAHLTGGTYSVVVDNGVAPVTTSVRFGGEPAVAKLSASKAAAGTTVTVTGTNFLPSATVDFQGVPATVLGVDSPTSLRVRVPAGTAGGRAIVHVTTSQGTSSASKGSLFVWG